MISKRKAGISLAVNIIITLVTVAVVISYFFQEPSVLTKNGYESFRFFTTDSNILAGISAAVTAFYDIRIIKGKTDTLPKWALLLKYVGTACVFMTFSVTAFFLLPLYGPIVYSGTLILFHVTNPLAALFSLMFLETSHRIHFRETLLAVIPIAVYGAVYLTEVVIIGEENGGWRDFYGFNRGGQWFLAVLLLSAGGLAAAVLTALLHNIKVLPKKRQQNKNAN